MRHASCATSNIAPPYVAHSARQQPSRHRTPHRRTSRILRDNSHRDIEHPTAVGRASCATSFIATSAPTTVGRAFCATSTIATSAPTTVGRAFCATSTIATSAPTTVRRASCATSTIATSNTPPPYVAHLARHQPSRHRPPPTVGRASCATTTIATSAPHRRTSRILRDINHRDIGPHPP